MHKPQVRLSSHNSQVCKVQGKQSGFTTPSKKSLIGSDKLHLQCITDTYTHAHQYYKNKTTTSQAVDASYNLNAWQLQLTSWIIWQVLQVYYTAIVPNLNTDCSNRPVNIADVNMFAQATGKMRSCLCQHGNLTTFRLKCLLTENKERAQLEVAGVGAR